MSIMKSIKSFLWTFLILLLISFGHSILAAEIELSKFVPEDDEITGWVRDGDTAVATDEESLFELINGAAPFYIDRGAKQVVFQDYVKDDVYLTLEIYRMNTQDQAKQLYTGIEVENPEALEDIGTEGRFVSGLVGAYLLEYWQKTFFIRLTITDKSQQSKEIVLKFAKLVSEKIE